MFHRRRTGLFLCAVLACAGISATAGDVTAPGRVRIVSGAFGAQRVTEEDLSITVPPGGAVRGRLRLRLENEHLGILPMRIVATTTWDAPQKSWWPIRNAVPVGTSEIEIEIDRVAPDHSGMQYVVFAMAPARDHEQLVSGTDEGTPTDWERGRVLARLPRAAFRLAARDGWIPVDRFRPEGPRRAGIAMAVLRLVVGPGLPAQVEERVRVDARRRTGSSPCSVLFWFREAPQPHALVFCLREDPETDTANGEAFGLYTARDARGQLQSQIGRVPRRVVNALLDGSLEPTTHELACRVDERQLRTIEVLQDFWEGRARYGAENADVVKFFQDVVRELRLAPPPVESGTEPAEYLRGLLVSVQASPPEGPLPYPDVAGLAWAFVPDGSYEIGTPKEERGRDETLESLPRQVEVEAFSLSTTEVTQSVYGRFAALPEGPHRGPYLPVHSVTWQEAEQFCEALGRAEPEFVFSLPTEIEWEVACRGTLDAAEGFVAAQSASDRTKLRDASAEDARFVLAKYAWFGAAVVGPQRVGRRTPTAWLLETTDGTGLCDMHGNLMEWCRRSLEVDWKQPGLLEEPVRGGGYLSRLERCRAGARTFVQRDARLGTIGFRVVARHKE